MNAKSIFTVLALVGSSTAALAAPAADPCDTPTTTTIKTAPGHQVIVAPVVRPIAVGEYNPSIPHRPVYRPVDYKPVYRPAPIEYKPVYRPAPVPVSTYHPPIKQEVSLGTQNTRWFGNKTFFVGNYAGRFETLKLESERGRSFIDTVTIKFMDGRVQTVRLDKDLDKGSPCLTIDLAGNFPRAIASVTVRGVNARRSAFELKAV